MAVLYLFIVLVIMVLNFDKLPGILVQIVKSAFGLEQVGGGVIGMGTSISMAN